jgi:hypothetical protein
MIDTEITTGELAKLLDTSPKTMTDPKKGSTPCTTSRRRTWAKA